jgi:undecaprenyl phosphate N,N'-diacetylbacillosamine 1-phosphate transferase
MNILYQPYIKRQLDLCLSLILFMGMLPLFALLCMLLTLANRGNPFFVQRRPGKGGHLFSILKFKTMKDLGDASGKLLPDKLRLTPLGRIVRKLSLDELPQLLNVIKGDMSLVGPRPLLEEYLPHYTDVQRRRHEVKPGITGWAQVNGRNALSWEQKFILDVWYVDHCGISLDLNILLITIGKVFTREGISSRTSVTSEKFTEIVNQ